LGAVAAGGIAVAAGGSSGDSNGSGNNGGGGINTGVTPPNNNTSLAVAINNAFARGADGADIAAVFAERVAFTITGNAHPNYSNVHNTIKKALANAMTDAVGATDARKLIGELDFDAIAEAMEQMVATSTSLINEEDNSAGLALSTNVPDISELMSDQPISAADNDAPWGFISLPSSSSTDDMIQPLVIV